MKSAAAVAAASAVAGLVVLFALAGHPERLGRAALRVERMLPARLAGVARARSSKPLRRDSRCMRQPVRLLTALALSFPMWMSIAAGIWLTSRAFHITFPYTGSFLVMTMLVVGVAAPTPGGVGAFHAAYQFAVTEFFSAPADRAVGAAIVLHAVSFVPVTLLGLIFMAREGLTFGSARRIASRGKRRAASSGDIAAGRDGARGTKRRTGRAPGGERRAMKCPYCGNLGDKVVDSRESKEGDVIRRRRQCLDCAQAVHQP